MSGGPCASSVARVKYLASLPERERLELKSLNARFFLLASHVLWDLHRWCKSSKQNFFPRVVKGRRNWQEQFDHYKKGRIKKDDSWIVIDEKRVVTYAHPNFAPHCFGMALDIWFIYYDVWDETDKGVKFRKHLPDAHVAWPKIGEFAEGHGLVSGRNFKRIKDYPHIEMPRWRWLAKLLEEKPQ